MGNRGIKYFLVLFFAITPLMIKADPATLSISQVNVDSTEMKIYLTLLDTHQNYMQLTDKNKVKVRLDGRLLDVKDLTIFKDNDQGVTYTLLLDVSGTMKGEPFNKLSALVKDIPRTVRPKDRVAVITFGKGVTVISDFTNDYQAIMEKFRLIQPVDSETHLHLAIKKSFEMNHIQNPDLPKRRAIIIIADGKDEGSGITPDDIARQIEKTTVPSIYAVGYSRVDRSYLDKLKRFAHLSGGQFTESQDFKEIYNNIVKNIQEQWVVRVDLPEIKMDSSTRIIQVTVTKDNSSISNTRNIILAQSEDNNHSNDFDLFWIYLISIILFLILSAILWYQWRKIRNKNDFETKDPFVDHTTQPISELGEETKFVETTVYQHTEITKGRQFIQLIILDTQEPFKKRAVGKRINLPIDQKGIIIGSDENVDIVLHDHKVAKQHCLIEQFGEKLILRNFDREMITFLNGIPIPYRDLIKNEDVIMIGDSKIRVVIGTL